MIFSPHVQPARHLRRAGFVLPPPHCLRCGRPQNRQCLRCGLPVRARQRPAQTPLRPPWRAPVRPHWNPAAPRQIDPQANILTAPGTTAILADAGGTIIDDPSPTPSCCCGCPDCFVPRSADEICACIPTELLIVVAGVVLCSCFISDSSPSPPHSHTEVLGSADIAVCTTDTDKTIPGLTHKAWGNDGPPDCAPPTFLADVGVGQWNGGMSFGAVVHAQLNIYTQGGFQVLIFAGAGDFGANCEGPWTISNSLGGCSYSAGATIGGHGGTATFYACKC